MSGSANSTVSGFCAAASAPPGRILALRALVRHRDVLVQTAGTYVQRMQKALVEMNLLLPRVVSDIVGKTGMSLIRSQTALGAFYRRLAVRIGKPKAITATARKLAILVYRTLTGTIVYRDPGADIYNARQRARLVRRLKQRADTLGFALVNRETGEVLGATVF